MAENDAKPVLFYSLKCCLAMTSTLQSRFFFKNRRTATGLFARQQKFNGKGVNFCFGVLFLSLTVFLLTACTTTYAPVEQRGTAYGSKKHYAGKLPSYHLVRKGDTLYSIAWRYGLDYKQIAYRNRIKSPYKIFAGQKLRIGPIYSRKTTASRAFTSRSSKKISYKTKVSGGSGRKKVSSKKKSNTKSSSNKKISSNKTRSGTKSTGFKRSAKPGGTAKAVSNNKTAAFKGNKRLKWIWPVKGKVIQSYSPGSGKKGIDISAPRGTLIKSAEAGKVVYSGQGLVGYGRLIIIKHNDTYLSAYAHNQQLLVNEGQLVKKGQNIARLGRSGTNRYKLHFEIRKNGKPVNPVSYLPR